jgi:hypothetical protein
MTFGADERRSGGVGSGGVLGSPGCSGMNLGKQPSIDSRGSVAVERRPKSATAYHSKFSESGIFVRRRLRFESAKRYAVHVVNSRK